MSELGAAETPGMWQISTCVLCVPVLGQREDSHGCKAVAVIWHLAQDLMKENIQCFDPLTSASQKIYSHVDHALKWSPRRCCFSRHCVCWDSHGISPFSQPSGQCEEKQKDVKSWSKCKALKVAHKWELKEGESFVSVLSNGWGCPETCLKCDEAKLRHIRSFPMFLTSSSWWQGWRDGDKCYVTRQWVMDSGSTLG